MGNILTVKEKAPWAGLEDTEGCGCVPPPVGTEGPADVAHVTIPRTRGRRLRLGQPGTHHVLAAGTGDGEAPLLWQHYCQEPSHAGKSHAQDAGDGSERTELSPRHGASLMGFP